MNLFVTAVSRGVCKLEDGMKLSLFARLVVLLLMTALVMGSIDPGGPPLQFHESYGSQALAEVPLSGHRSLLTRIPLWVMAAGGAALFMTAHMGRMGFWHSVAVALLPGPIGLSKIKDSPLRVTWRNPRPFIRRAAAAASAIQLRPVANGNPLNTAPPPTITSSRPTTKALDEAPAFRPRASGKVVDIGPAALWRLVDALADEIVRYMGLAVSEVKAPLVHKSDPKQLWLPFPGLNIPASVTPRKDREAA